MRLTSTKASSGQNLGDGLYAILGNDSDGHDGQDFTLLYDKHGVLRAEIPILYYRSQRLLFDKNGLLWVQRRDDDHGRDEQPEQACEDIRPGRPVPSYKKTTRKTGSIYATKENSRTNSGTKVRWDLMHINTIQYTEDGSVLLSSRETSTVTMFDNNYGNSPTRPGFDWSQIDGINTGLHGNVLEVQQVPDGRNHARGLGSQGPVRHLQRQEQADPAVADRHAERKHLQGVSIRFQGLLLRIQSVRRAWHKPPAANPAGGRPAIHLRGRAIRAIGPLPHSRERLNASSELVFQSVSRSGHKNPPVWTAGQSTSATMWF